MELAKPLTMSSGASSAVTGKNVSVLRREIRVSWVDQAEGPSRLELRIMQPGTTMVTPPAVRMHRLLEKAH